MTPGYHLSALCFHRSSCINISRSRLRFQLFSDCLSPPSSPLCHRRTTRSLSMSTSTTASSASHLRDLNLLKSSSYIDGQFTTTSVSSTPLVVTNPSTGSPIHTLDQASDSDIARAFATTKAAFEQEQRFPTLTITDRLNILSRLHAILDANTHDLATLITLENGKPYAQSVAEVRYAQSFIPWSVQPALHRHSDTYVDVHTAQSLHYTTRVPVGSVLCITPWNFPLALLVRKLVPALAAGCGVVCKPSELTPLTALALAHLIHNGLPELPRGLVNVIVSSDGKAVVDIGMEKKLVDMVSFTGSTKVGALVAAKAMSHACTNVSLELGGNAPFIVTELASKELLEKCVQDAVDNKVRCSGQACVSANRFFVHDSIYDEFVELLSTRVAQLTVGYSLDENEPFDLGPVINVASKNRIERLVQDAVADGACITTTTTTTKAPPSSSTSSSSDKDSCMMKGIVVSEVTDDMQLASCEIFGPVWSVLRFSSVTEVIERANKFNAGLAAYVYGGDAAHVQHLTHGLRYGMVAVNSGSVSDTATPFGGMRESGCGREGGMQAITAYTQLKYVKQCM